MVRHFEEELMDLKERLLKMGTLVEGMINNATLSILEQNEGLKRELIEHEKLVNKTQIEIDDVCITMIALRQPAAVDLRFITAAMKINSDLERMGDQAVNIAGHVVKSTGPVPKPIEELLIQMSQKVKKMTCDSLESFLKKDVPLAQAVLESDDEVDSLKEEIQTKITACMKEDPVQLTHSLDLLLISRNLERIGDHATNIAEDVIYMVLGKDIRHHVYENR